MKLTKALPSQLQEIYNFYKDVIEGVVKSPVNLGWNLESYPSLEWMSEEISKGELYLWQDGTKILGAAAVNYSTIPEYKNVDWKVKSPEEKISTIHAFATLPETWGNGTAPAFLNAIIGMCRKNGDIANHLDVIDSNEKALKLYLKCGFTEIDNIEMYYEVVGTRKFWMLEYIF